MKLYIFTVLFIMTTILIGSLIAQELPFGEDMNDPLMNLINQPSEMPENREDQYGERNDGLEIPEYTPGATMAGDDYILGPGDFFVVYVKSLNERTYRVGVNPQGKIFLPMVGELSVSGMSLRQLQAALYLEFSKYLKDIQVSVALIRLRRIIVQVLGQVRRPGIYQFFAIDRVSTAIGAAGGATRQASIRNVDILRKGEKIATIDLYKYLRENDQSQNPRLEFGDIIFLPVSSNFVRISGQVLNPGRYEIKEGEKLLDLVTMAGGFTPRASMDVLKIYNIINPEKVITVDMKGLALHRLESMNLPLKPGDVVTVPSIPVTVTVVGQVQKPGTFAYEPGTLVSYYIGLAGGYGERANLRNIKINRWGGKSVKGKEESLVEAGDVIVVGGLEIKGWRDYIQVIMQTATIFFIIWQVAK